jgi:hypothetical protein
MHGGGDTSVEELQAEIARLRAEVSELRHRERALRSEAEVERRRAAQRAGALHAEFEYVREQAVGNRRLADAAQEEARRLADAAQEEARHLRTEAEWLRRELAAAQQWIARSPYFRMRHLVGRLVRRRH